MEWSSPVGFLHALEATDEEVAAAAPTVSEFYNEPHNRFMLANKQEMSAADVSEYAAQITRDGGRYFLLYHDGSLVGDADIRRVEAGRGETTIVIGRRAMQGKGLGTRLAIMVHAVAFESLGLSRVYGARVPTNVASARYTAKLGYELDDTPLARSFATSEDQVTDSLHRERFRQVQSAALADMKISERS